MRIGLFADQLLYRLPGGIGTYLRGLLQELPRIDQADDFVLLHHGAAGSISIPGSRFTERRLPGRRAQSLAWHSVGRPRVERWIGALDLLHAPSLVVPPSRSPLIVTVHDLCVVKFPELFPRRWRIFHERGLKLAMRKASIILVDSESTRSDLLELGRYDPSRVRVVPLGVHVPQAPGAGEVAAVLA
ncbi:MAG: glycosyltransferase, partial [Candidatus Geothermincolia bacterium]